MKKLATTFGVLAVLALAAAPSFAANPVRISQVYGGGGGSGAATYKQDYVEIFNNSGAAINIGGWTIEYGSATGNWGSSAANIFTFPANTLIQPCKYLMVAVGTAGTGGAAFPITPDFTSTVGPSMSGTAGKVAIFNAVNTNLACGSELAGTLVDKVSYGTGNCPEVTNVGATSITTGAVRNGAEQRNLEVVGDPVLANEGVARLAAEELGAAHVNIRVDANLKSRGGRGRNSESGEAIP